MLIRFTSCGTWLMLVALHGCAATDHARPTPMHLPDEAGAIPGSAAPALTLDLGGVKMAFVEIPAGQFMMGSPETEIGRRENEGTQRAVQVPNSFYLGQYEVTEAQWNAVMPDNPSRYKGNDLPVHWVSAADAQTFCQRLTARLGRQVRLPTEAEWEYACRAGTTTAYPFGEASDNLARHAWYDGHSRRSPNPVGGKEPNAWGLYDMLGNVWEWCADAYQPGYAGAPTDGTARQAASDDDYRRVLRGGSWFDKAEDLRSASRMGRPAGMRSIYIGFRVVTQ